MKRDFSFRDRGISEINTNVNLEDLCPISFINHGTVDLSLNSLEFSDIRKVFSQYARHYSITMVKPVTQKYQRDMEEYANEVFDYLYQRFQNSAILIPEFKSGHVDLNENYISGEDLRLIFGDRLDYFDRLINEETKLNEMILRESNIRFNSQELTSNDNKNLIYRGFVSSIDFHITPFTAFLNMSLNHTFFKNLGNEFSDSYVDIADIIQRFSSSLGFLMAREFCLAYSLRNTESTFERKRKEFQKFKEDISLLNKSDLEGIIDIFVNEPDRYKKMLFYS